MTAIIAQSLNPKSDNPAAPPAFQIWSSHDARSEIKTAPGPLYFSSYRNYLTHLSFAKRNLPNQLLNTIPHPALIFAPSKPQNQLESNGVYDDAFWAKGRERKYECQLMSRLGYCILIPKQRLPGKYEGW